MRRIYIVYIVFLKHVQKISKLLNIATLTFKINISHQVITRLTCDFLEESRTYLRLVSEDFSSFLTHGVVVVRKQSLRSRAYFHTQKINHREIVTENTSY
jgi:hypothetical protein